MKSDKVDEHLSPICDTAFLIAGLRYFDYTTKKVGDDKYAEILAGEQGIEYAKTCLDRAPFHKDISFAGHRTRCIDVNTKKYCEENNIKQILILAAGLDSRPYRLEIDTHPIFFEVDTEPMIDYKNTKMAEHGIKPLYGLVSIAHDLRNPGLIEKLVEKGFNKELKTFIIIEGLFEYLPISVSVDILKMMADVVPSGSYVMCTTPSENICKSGGYVFEKVVEVAVEKNAHPSSGTDDVERDILKPAGFKLVYLCHTLQASYFSTLDLSNPAIKEFYDRSIKVFEETGKGPREQFYVGCKL